MAGAAAAWSLLTATSATAAVPVPESDLYRMASTTGTLVIPAPGVLANDTDADGDTIRAELFSPTSSGALDLRPSGRFTYTPNPGFSGLDSFTYLATDGSTDPYRSGYVYISVTEPPVATDDSYGAVSEVMRAVPRPGVLENDVGADATRLKTPPRHGTLEFGSTGRFRYTSDPGFVGTDSFVYRAVVRGEAPSPATVTLQVKPRNARPVAEDDTFNTDEDLDLNVPAAGVLTNDTDRDGDPLTAQLVSYPFGESFELHRDGSFEYTPPLDYDSPVSFTYRTTDGTKWSEPATATIEIRAVSDPPVALDDEYYLGGGTGLDVPAPGVLGNDYDEIEGDSLFAELGTAPAKGTVDLAEDGSFTYERTPGKRGIDVFTYQVSDSGGAQGNLAYVTIHAGSG